MDGPAWKRQRMDDGPGGPSRQDSVFYKTRMCHKCAFLPCWPKTFGQPLCIIMANHGRKARCEQAHENGVQGEALWTWTSWQKMHISAQAYI